MEAREQIEKLIAIYHAAEDLVMPIGLHGEYTFNTFSEEVQKLMDAMFEYDGGCREGAPPIPESEEESGK